MKYQTVNIEVPLGASSLVEKGAITLHSSYARAAGLAVHLVEGPEKVRIGLKDRAGQIIDRVILENIRSTSNVPHNNRFMELDIPTHGTELTIEVVPIGALASKLSLDFVFLLEKEE